jgi:hypothetical protein
MAEEKPDAPKDPASDYYYQDNEQDDAYLFGRFGSATMSKEEKARFREERNKELRDSLKKRFPDLDEEEAIKIVLARHRDWFLAGVPRDPMQCCGREDTPLGARCPAVLSDGKRSCDDCRGIFCDEHTLIRCELCQKNRCVKCFKVGHCWGVGLDYCNKTVCADCWWAKRRCDSCASQSQS